MRNPHGVPPQTAPPPLEGRLICHTLLVMRVTVVSSPDMCLNFDSGTPESTASAASVREIS